mmetsp:Transcript_5971/g.10572  ORF Transcript_5971/g.10572 Transcript_5971/m.10572 type:complete len:243 (-) Transcript_5971:198-926(-)
MERLSSSILADVAQYVSFSELLMLRSVSKGVKAKVAESGNLMRLALASKIGELKTTHEYDLCIQGQQAQADIIEEVETHRRSFEQRSLLEVLLYAHPPPQILKVMSVACIIAEKKQEDKLPWNECKAVLSKGDFLNRLCQIDFDYLANPAVRKLISDYINSPYAANFNWHSSAAFVITNILRVLLRVEALPAFEAYEATIKRLAQLEKLGRVEADSSIAHMRGMLPLSTEAKPKEAIEIGNP